MFSWKSAKKWYLPCDGEIAEKFSNGIYLIYTKGTLINNGKERDECKKDP